MANLKEINYIRNHPSTTTLRKFNHWCRTKKIQELLACNFGLCFWLISCLQFFFFFFFLLTNYCALFFLKVGSHVLIAITADREKEWKVSAGIEREFYFHFVCAGGGWVEKGLIWGRSSVCRWKVEREEKEEEDGYKMVYWFLIFSFRKRRKIQFQSCQRIIFYFCSFNLIQNFIGCGFVLL